MNELDEKVRSARAEYERLKTENSRKIARMNELLPAKDEWERLSGEVEDENFRGPIMNAKYALKQALLERELATSAAPEEETETVWGPAMALAADNKYWR